MQRYFQKRGEATTPNIIALLSSSDGFRHEGNMHKAPLPQGMACRGILDPHSS